MALALPSVVFASSSVDFSNNGGKLKGSKKGLTLSGSVLVAVDGLNGGGLITGSDLGSVSLTTGHLVSGSLQIGGTFAAGGSFTITGNGQDGVPNGTLFSGTFSSPVTWTMVMLANGTHNYTLTGTLSGTLGSGFQTVGVTVQLTVNTEKDSSTDAARFPVETRMSWFPGPSSLGLLGTGLIIWMDYSVVS